MGKVLFKLKKGLGSAMKSEALGDQLEAIAAPVLEQAQQDPNKFYVSTLDMHRFVSSGRSGRVSIQIGAAEKIGRIVEAKRGTLAKALGRVG